MMYAHMNIEVVSGCRAITFADIQDVGLLVGPHA